MKNKSAVSKAVIVISVIIIIVSIILYAEGQRQMDEAKAYYGRSFNELYFYWPGEQMRDYAGGGIVVGVCMLVWGIIMAYLSRKESVSVYQMPDLLAEHLKANANQSVQQQNGGIAEAALREQYIAGAAQPAAGFAEQLQHEPRNAVLTPGITILPRAVNYPQHGAQTPQHGTQSPQHGTHAGTWTCPECGWVNSNGQSDCIGCCFLQAPRNEHHAAAGHQVAAHQTAQNQKAAKQSAKPAIRIKLCPRCKAYSAGNFCPRCGAKVTK